MRTLLLYTLFSLPLILVAQRGTVKGKVIDEITKEPIPFANVVILGTTTGSASDFDGLFEIKDVEPGYIKVEVSVVGYERFISADLYVTPTKTPFVELGLIPSSTQLKEIVIETSAFEKTEESPVSLQTLGVEEIERNPGANRDISRVIQSLPGVASTPSFRNDIIIRGGAPNENRFYLDEIETPIINHFQTQGSSGGPVGMLNVNLVREVNLFTGAFPANRGNTLSSVLEFKQLDGNKEKLNVRGTVGSSDLALAADGPIGDKTTFIASVRRSYLQALFSVLGLPFLPTYNDAQFKIKHQFNQKNQLSIIGLGAIDQFRLNEGVNDNIDDPETLERNNYILAQIPSNEQWNYTIGGVYKHFRDKSFQTVVVSRNALNNRAIKYQDNDESDPANKILDFQSTETENKVRVEHTYREGSNKLNVGVNLENAIFTNTTFNRIGTPVGETVVNFSSELTVLKYGFFGQYSRNLLQGRLILSAGLRLDANDYNQSMQNPLNQFSPRLSASYSLTDKWSVNFNTGIYYQLPAYTILGFRNNANQLVNQANTRFIRNDQIVGGIQFNPDVSTKITVEGFYKDYAYYPFSLRDSISLANLGADFGVIGNEATASIGDGRAYGVEVLVQRRSKGGLFGILAYTWVRSEFEDKFGNFVPSAWDSRNLVSLTAGKKFKKNWELGFKWRFAGGLPYTPFNEEASARIENWNVNNQGIRDFDQLNALRLGSFNQLDIRVDKSWYLKRFSLNLYFDIQNALNFKAEQPDFLNVETDAQGNRVVDPNNPNSYVLYRIPNEAGTVVPTIGLIIDF